MTDNWQDAVKGIMTDDLAAFIESTENTPRRVKVWWMIRRGGRWIRYSPRQVRWAWQRLTRGWDDRVVWDLDRHLCRTLGQQLILLSKSEDNNYWYYGEMLLRCGDEQLEDTGLAYAKTALQWVTDTLEYLWD